MVPLILALVRQVRRAHHFNSKNLQAIEQPCQWVVWLGRQSDVIHKLGGVGGGADDVDWPLLQT